MTSLFFYGFYVKSSFYYYTFTSKVDDLEDQIQGVPECMTQFQNFIKNKQVKIQRKLKYFLKGYDMPFSLVHYFKWF